MNYANPLPRKLTTLIRCGLFCSLPLFAAASASAELLAYEGFGDYALGGLDGVAGSAGSGIVSWQGNNQLFLVRAQTLDYGMPTDPQHLDMTSWGTELMGSFDVSPQGPFANYIDSLGRIGKDGTTLYISFLFRVDNNAELLSSGVVQANWLFRKSSAGNVGAWGVQQPWGFGTINLRNGPVLLPQLDRKLHLVILRIDYLAGADNVTAWVDPVLGGAEEVYTPTASQTLDASFDQLYLMGQGNKYFFDELRIGETFDDVTANIRLSPPAAPINLAVATLSDTELVLTWEDLALNETGFRVERALAASGPFEVLPNLPADTTQLVDSGLLPSTAYFYRVHAFNDFDQSQPTALVSSTTLAEGQTVPATPGNFVGTLVDRKISLSWTEDSGWIFGYRVYRAAGAGNFVLIAQIGAGSTQFLDVGPPTGANLRYRVTSFNELGESLATEVALGAIAETSSGVDWVWIEAENFATTTFPGNGVSFLSPQPSEVEGLSNGNNFSFAATQSQENAGFVFNYNITYNVDIPTDGEYILYVRRAVYGVFKWRIDNGEWNYVRSDADKVGSVPWREFFPLVWYEGGSTVTTAGQRTLEISVNPSVDFPHVDPRHKKLHVYDCFLLTQVPFRSAGKAKPGVKWARANDGYWPFEPGDDLYAQSPIDLSYLNEDVAGQDGWVTREGDSFILGNGSKVRFFGVGVSKGSFSSYSSQARFLAKKGVNIVRWHESIDDRDINSDSIFNVNEAAINRAQQCVAAFKQHGIYTNLSYFFILNYHARAAWNIPGFDLQYTSGGNRQPFGIFFWNEDFKAAYKAWVHELLTRPNPWDTGNKPLAQDPAVAMIEILNEDNLFFYTFLPSGYPEVQRLALEKMFGDWLIVKFGSLEAAVAQWGGSLRSRDKLQSGHIEVLSAGTLRPGVTSLALRTQLQAQWMAEVQTSFWEEMRDYIRSLGCQALVIPTNWKTARDKNLLDLEFYTYSAVDTIDTHNYFASDGSSVLSYAVSAGDTYRNISAVDRPSEISALYKQVADRPNIISEFTWVSPNDMASEAPLIVAAYGSLQDVDGLIWFNYGGTVGYETAIQRWPVGSPDIMGQFPGAALMYRRGDVAAAPVAFREGRSAESLGKLEDSLIVQGSGFDPTRDTGWDPQTGEGILGMETALVGKVELAFGEDWDYLHPDFYDHADFGQGIFKSLTGQLELNKPQGIVRVDTPTAQGVTSFLGDSGEIALGDCIIRMENTFGAVLVISLDGLPLSRSGKVLIQAAAPINLYGYEVQAATHLGQPAYKILSLGDIPFGMQDIKGEVLLKGFAGAQAQILDINGYPVAAPVSFAEGDNLRVLLPFNSLYTVVTRETADAAPVILSKSLPSPVVGKDYTGRLHASGGTGNYTWSVAGGLLPAGISLAPSGKLSGMTNATLAAPVTVRVEDSTGATAEATLPVSIISELVKFEMGWVDDAVLGFIFMESPEWAYSFYLGWIYLPYRPWLYANPVGWMFHAAGNVNSGRWWYSSEWGWIIVYSNFGGFFQYSNNGGATWTWHQFSL